MLRIESRPGVRVSTLTGFHPSRKQSRRLRRQDDEGGPSHGRGSRVLDVRRGYATARCLRDHADPAIAFKVFDRLRRPRVDAVLRQSRRTGARKAPTGWLGRRMRDLVLPMFLRKGATDAGRLYAYAPDWHARAPLSLESPS